ncbi:uncharacterized protein LOC131647945 [Vicia villosa]|uniref:uncharacterized protein LOC131647945 n=1 Tax=Vicia villosa TaxID=3911 RepID=UPI00273B9A83|nr:uncharacterized protein LOC131647945 [Vicia villosa]
MSEAGTCFINGVSLNAIIDIGATRSFISLDCANKLSLEVSSMTGSVVIDTPTNGSIVLFPESKESEDSRFMFVGQVEMSLRENDQVLMTYTSLRVESDVVDICDLRLKQEVEFAIDIVPGTSHVSMTPYRMSLSELSVLKKHLEDLLEKKFVRPSVSSWGAPTFLVNKKDATCGCGLIIGN